MDDLQTHLARLPYQRPRLGRVELAAEQVLSSGCKTNSGSGNVGSGSVCSSGSCSTIIGTS